MNNACANGLALPDKRLEIDGKSWFMMEDVAEFLGFEEVAAVSHLFRRHQQHLESLSRIAKLPTWQQRRRVFNAEGVYTMAILATSPRAVEIRKAMLQRMTVLEPWMLS